LLNSTLSAGGRRVRQHTQAVNSGKALLDTNEQPVFESPKTKAILEAFLLGLLLVLIASVLILSWVPPVSKDALTHHLAVPKLYLKHGGIYEIPFMSFSYYPMNLDLLYLIPLYFGNDIIPKFIHFGFALLTAWLIFYHLRRRINQVYAMVGSVFFLSIPIIVKLSITVYVDLGLIFFSTLSLLLLLKWLEHGFDIKWLVFSAVFCGLALGTKYNGLIIFFLLGLFVPFIKSRYCVNERNRFAKALGSGILFGLVALLIFSPWMIRNYHWTGNPIFPLYDNWFNPQTGFSQNRLDPFTVRKLVFHESVWDIILVPLRVFIEGQDGNPQYFDGKLNPFLLLLTFFAFRRTGTDSRSLKVEKKILLAFSVLYFAFAFFRTSMRIRYILPIVPPMVVLSIYGLKNLVDIASKAKSKNVQRAGIIGISAVMVFALWLNAVYVFKQYKVVEPYGFLTGTMSRDGYIEKYRPEYAAMKYINENLLLDAKILFIHLGNRGYYCDRDYLFDMQRGVSTLHQIVKNSSFPQEVVLELKRRKITHFLVRHDLFKFWAKNNFDGREMAILDQLFEKYLRMIYFRKGYGVYRLENLDMSCD
jgi:4-amino-4-deoxy-L-arabinose transferase-like glycosyltransferase